MQILAFIMCRKVFKGYNLSYVKEQSWRLAKGSGDSEASAFEPQPISGYFLFGVFTYYC